LFFRRKSAAEFACKCVAALHAKFFIDNYADLDIASRRISLCFLDETLLHVQPGLHCPREDAARTEGLEQAERAKSKKNVH
jgi:hypothetical protein